MTEAGMNPLLMQVLIVGTLVMASGNLIAFITFWMKMEGRLKAGEAALIQANLAIGKVELLADSFAKYREYAAKEFLSDKELIESENRVTKSVEDLRTDVREQMGGIRMDVQKLAERFDRFLQSELERARAKE